MSHLPMEQIRKLTDAELDEKIHPHARLYSHHSPRRSPMPVQPYSSSLGLMHELEERELPAELAEEYNKALGRTGIQWLWHANARRRAEAFLFVSQEAKS